jgi:hypothetical protein
MVTLAEGLEIREIRIFTLDQTQKVRRHLRMDSLKTARKFLIFAVFLLTGCATQHKDTMLSNTVGPWENLYKGDRALAGVFVLQYPEGADSWKDYEYKHPGLIEYFFWDGRVRQIVYRPDGSVHDDFWWPYKIKPGDGWWGGLDFSYGSDPEFKRHKDPRKP